MINESTYWQEELFKSSRWLVDALSKKRWLDRSYGKLEKSIMISAYSIRKLGEASKISKSFFQQEIDVEIYKKHKIINQDNVAEEFIENIYDFKHRSTGKIKIGTLLNQIIHSHLFVPVFNANKQIAAILINSDYTKDKVVYLIKYKAIIDIILSNSSGSISLHKCIIRDGNLYVTDTIYENKTKLKIS